MDLERPDLTLISPDVRAYIEALEAELATRRKAAPRTREGSPDEVTELSEPSELPTTIQVITATAAGMIKRTPRHLYDRQLRGGMGVFDLDAPEEDPPFEGRFFDPDSRSGQQPPKVRARLAHSW